MESYFVEADENDIHLKTLKTPQNRHNQVFDEEDELDEAIDLCLHGKEIPLDDTLQIILQRISTILYEARADGARIFPRSLMILCVDEAKQACAEGVLSSSLLADAALTLCLAAQKILLR